MMLMMIIMIIVIIEHPRRSVVPGLRSLMRSPFGLIDRLRHFFSFSLAGVADQSQQLGRSTSRASVSWAGVKQSLEEVGRDTCRMYASACALICEALSERLFHRLPAILLLLYIL